MVGWANERNSCLTRKERKAVISVHNEPPSHSCVCVLTDRISPLIWYPAFGTEKDAGKYIRGQDADSLPWKPAARGGDFFCRWGVRHTLADPARCSSTILSAVLGALYLT
jgi:hypothetical protein